MSDGLKILLAVVIIAGVLIVGAATGSMLVAVILGAGLFAAAMITQS